MLVSNSKGIVYIFQSCRGKFAGGLNYRGEKGNVTFMQSSQTKCHLPTGLALHGELQIARSAAKQKKNLKTNAWNYCASEKLGTMCLFKHGKSVQLTYGRGLGGGTSSKPLVLLLVPVNFGLLILFLAGFLSEVKGKSSRTWNQRWWIQWGWRGIRLGLDIALSWCSYCRCDSDKSFSLRSR